jgi:hypothetical protein
MNRTHFVLKAQKLQILSALVLCLSFFAWTTAHAQITPLGDSYIDTATPTTNYGAKTLLDVDGASQTTYIQFNLASIPSTASVSQATLKLYVNAVTTAGSFNVDYVNGAWSEGKIDASNAPALGAAIASNVSVTTADKNQYILINVTSAVQAWLNGSETNNGLALIANSSFNATFDSKENTTTSHAAELDIAFAGGDGTITGVTTAGGSGLTGGGTSGTLNLSLTNACAANQVLQWSGSAWACSSAGTGTITGVTAGTGLTGGGTSGNVTLNLNTSQIPLLAGSNVFTANNLFESTVNFNGLASFANASFAELGVGTSSPLSNVDVIGGGGMHTLIGNPGCGTFAAIGFLTSPFSDCTNYALLGDSAGGTYINASGDSQTIHFRINNSDVMDVFDGPIYGTLYENGIVGINTSTPAAALEVVWDGASEIIPFAAEGANGSCDMDSSGDLHCTGVVSGDAQVDGGTRTVAMSAIESPVNWVEDFGSARLVNGAAVVELDPTYIQTVNSTLDYKVFPVPNGDCKGLYVTNKTATSFEVRELGGGTSSVDFDYRITAVRKNYETVRFADHTREMELLKHTRQPTKSMGTTPQPSDTVRGTQAVPKPSQRAEAQTHTVRATVPAIHQ